MCIRDRSSGCSTIELHGTDEARAEMWAKIETLAHEMYVADGGRDVPDAEHPRTYAQRLFDAAYELIMQQPAAGKLTNNTDTDADPSSNSEEEADDDTNGACDCGPAIRHKAPSPKTMLHVTLTVDDEAEQQIRAACPNGQGYLPDSVLERYA